MLRVLSANVGPSTYRASSPCGTPGRHPRFAALLARPPLAAWPSRASPPSTILTPRRCSGVLASVFRRRHRSFLARSRPCVSSGLIFAASRLLAPCLARVFRRGGPRRDRLRSPAAATARRACLHERAESQHERTRRQRYLGSFPLASPYSLASGSPSLAWRPPRAASHPALYSPFRGPCGPSRALGQSSLAVRAALSMVPAARRLARFVRAGETSPRSHDTPFALRVG